jgi:hypothetical protein
MLLACCAACTCKTGDLSYTALLHQSEADLEGGHLKATGKNCNNKCAQFCRLGLSVDVKQRSGAVALNVGRKSSCMQCLTVHTRQNFVNFYYIIQLLLIQPWGWQSSQGDMAFYQVII